MRFYLVEAFEVSTQKPSFIDRVRVSGEVLPPFSLNLARYLSPEASRVFEHSNSWFPLMHSCTLKLHIFGIEALDISDNSTPERLDHCMEQVRDIMLHAVQLSSLVFEVWFWPGRYDERKRSTWNAWNNPPSTQVFIDSIKPLQEISGVRTIELHADGVLEGSWDAETPDEFTVVPKTTA